VHLTTPVGGPVTNGTLLRRLRDADPPEQHTAEPEVDQAHAGEDERRWRPTVWFNPWMHQTGEQVWAGLVHEIITQVTGRMSVAEREHFWLRLNLSRIDEQAVRRRVYALVAGRLVPWLLGAVGAVVVGAVLLAGPGLAWAGTALAAGGPVAAALAGVAATRGVLAERARGVLGRAVTPGDLAGLVRVPDYAQGAGPLLSIRTDLERVLDLVATPARPLVVFVDDLDRCNPGTVVQVIEAVNLFVAGEHPNTVFVVAMEPEVVAAHVESAYGDLVTRLSTSSGPGEQTFDFGWRFLEKVVQLPLTLPTVAPERTRAYVASLFGPAQADAPGDGARAPDEVAVRVAEQHLGGTSSVDEALARVGPGAVGADGVGAAALREAARRVVERRLATDSPEVQAVVAFAAGHLEGNPRQVKRFVNVFRFFVMISAERRLRGLRGAVPLEALAKMALLLVRWPGLVEQLVAEPAAGNGPTLLAVLEECAGPEEARAVLDAEGLPDPVVRALLGDQLEQLLGSRPRVGRLTDGLL
jgi:hypothetical protein